MPAVLVEAGVIVNRKEEEILEQASTKKVIAAAIAQGIEDCKVLDLLL
jgi:N-acetylmuramoyl-L-alanine amidase